MIVVEGTWYDGCTSRPHAARLSIYADGQVRLELEQETRSWRLHELRISARVGDTPRRVFFPDGSQLETRDHAGLDEALARQRGGRGARWIHALESHWRSVLVCAALVVATLVAGGLWGIPELARAAAFALPPETQARIGRGTLDLLDRSVLAPSELDPPQRRRLRELLATLRAEPEAPRDLALRFRRGDELGANALALPDGTIVVTDELVALAEDDGELFAVLAHEVGHLVHRHALRQAIQSSLVAALVILVTGDLSSTSSVVAALPTLLVKTRYSRRFEGEADDYALTALDRAGIDPVHFARLLQRIEPTKGEESPLGGFLRTHPSSRERIERFRPRDPPGTTREVPLS